MKLCKSIFFTLLVAVVAMVLVSSCNSKVDHGGKTPLVSVGDSYLYMEDVVAMLATDSSQSERNSFALFKRHSII